jgi:hypothetical protein
MRIGINRKAIAMIELIFAIVIMGIVLMSAPTMISQASMGSMSAVQQEAIAAGATEISMIMTRAWDENDTNESDYAPILVVDENITALNEDSNNSGKRVGTPRFSSRSFVTAEGRRLDASSLGVDSDDSGDYDDIDDFDKNTTSLVTSESTTTEEGDYIDVSLSMEIDITYNNSPNITYTDTNISFDAPFSTTSTDTTNIKAISVHISSGSNGDTLDTNITLKSFMCNIGTFELQRRSF